MRRASETGEKCGTDPFPPGEPKMPFLSHFKLTAVAVCRTSCKDTLLSRMYFEFDNDTRKLKKAKDNPKHYQDGMAQWEALK